MVLSCEGGRLCGKKFAGDAVPRKKKTVKTKGSREEEVFDPRIWIIGLCILFINICYIYAHLRYYELFAFENKYHKYHIDMVKECHTGYALI